MNGGFFRGRNAKGFVEQLPQSKEGRTNSETEGMNECMVMQVNETR
jgi:hypothetical protein